MRSASFVEALDMAIEAEEKAYAMYKDLAGRAKNPNVEKLVSQFAEEEKRHKEKLLAVKDGGSLGPAITEVADLKISDPLAEPEITDGMEFRDILVLAMKAEKRAFELYSTMAEKFEEDSSEHLLFLQLAQEEAKHKLRFEIWYEDDYMKWN